MKVRKARRRSAPSAAVPGLLDTHSMAAQVLGNCFQELRLAASLTDGITLIRFYSLPVLDRLLSSSKIGRRRAMEPTTLKPSRGCDASDRVSWWSTPAFSICLLPSSKKAR